MSAHTPTDDAVDLQPWPNPLSADLSALLRNTNEANALVASGQAWFNAALPAGSTVDGGPVELANLLTVAGQSWLNEQYVAAAAGAARSSASRPVLARKALRMRWSSSATRGSCPRLAWPK